MDDQHDNAIEKINFHLDGGQGRAKAIMSYVQMFDHLVHQEQHVDLYKFRAITSHQGPLSPQDENYKCSKYNVMVQWETGEITEEPLSLIAAVDPVTCAVYAKNHDLQLFDGWKRLKHIAKNQEQLTRATNQSKIRQVRRSVVYHFGFPIPKVYKQALQLDEQNGNSKWYDATKLEMDQINGYIRSFKTMEKPRLIPNRGRYLIPQMDTRKSGFTSSLLSNMMVDIRLDWLLEDISFQIPLKASTLELSPSDPLDWLYF